VVKIEKKIVRTYKSSVVLQSWKKFIPAKK